MKIVFMKMRVGFRGGLEKYTRVLIQAFSAQGCQVTLLTTGKPQPIEGATTLSLAPDSKFTLYQLLYFDYLCKKWLQKNPQDIVFGLERTTSQTHYRAGNGVHAIYLQRRKMVDSWWKQRSFTINPLHQILLKMERKAFESPDLKVLFTNSQMVRKEILSLYATPAEKIHCIHNGVEWEKWGCHFEATFPKKEAPYHFLFVGNGYKRKGLTFLLEGLEQLKKRDFILTVIGKEKDPHYFVEQAKKMGLGKKILFLGAQSELIPFYQRADALVLPSIYDPFANVTNEALAMGLFVVTSQYNGGHEILQKNTGEIIDDLTSPESVARSLERAFDYPKNESRSRMIRESIKRLDFSNQLHKIVCHTIGSI
jgi:UDP-glucose:(heptosyl)LPS alpha-1,3-glucosyltransferase